MSTIDALEKPVMISTIDNPFNPFTHWEEWCSFDISHGHNSWEKVARLGQTSDLLSDEENQQIVRNAIFRLIELDPVGEYIAVYDE